MYRFLSLLLLVGMAQEIYSSQLKSVFLEIGAVNKTRLSKQLKNPSREVLDDAIVELTKTLQKIEQIPNNSKCTTHITYNRITRDGKFVHVSKTLNSHRTSEDVKRFNQCVERIKNDLSQ
jgi:hypothetical protein